MPEADGITPNLSDRVRTVAESMSPAGRFILLGCIDDDVARQIAAALNVPLDVVEGLSGQVLRAFKDRVFENEALPPPLDDYEPGRRLTPGGEILRLIDDEVIDNDRPLGS